MKVDKKVWVYRNLKYGKKAKPLYSIMQDGRVIDRRHRVLLRDVEFVIRPAGLKKCLETKRKNVHAFAVGYLCDDIGFDRDLPAYIHYNPFISGCFYSKNRKVKAAGTVLFNERGMSGRYLELE